MWKRLLPISFGNRDPHPYCPESMTCRNIAFEIQLDSSTCDRAETVTATLACQHSLQNPSFHLVRTHRQNFKELFRDCTTTETTSPSAHALVDFCDHTLRRGSCLCSERSAIFRPVTLWSVVAVYDNNPNNVEVGQILPPELSATQGGSRGSRDQRRYLPDGFNNDLVDASFGVTSKIFLDQYTPAGSLVNSLEVPNSNHIDRSSCR